MHQPNTLIGEGHRKTRGFRPSRIPDLHLKCLCQAAPYNQANTRLPEQPALSAWERGPQADSALLLQTRYKRDSRWLIRTQENTYPRKRIIPGYQRYFHVSHLSGVEYCVPAPDWGASSWNIKRTAFRSRRSVLSVANGCIISIDRQRKGPGTNLSPLRGESWTESLALGRFKL